MVNPPFHHWPTVRHRRPEGSPSRCHPRSGAASTIHCLRAPAAVTVDLGNCSARNSVHRPKPVPRQPGDGDSNLDPVSTPVYRSCRCQWAAGGRDVIQRASRATPVYSAASNALDRRGQPGTGRMLIHSDSDVDTRLSARSLPTDCNRARRACGRRVSPGRDLHDPPAWSRTHRPKRTKTDMNR